MQKPDWTLWTKRKMVRLHDALLLSMDIDPDSKLRAHQELEYEKRRKEAWIAKEEYSEFTSESYGFPASQMNTNVGLAEFAQWAKGRKWQIPDGFASLGDKIKKPLSTKERDTNSVLLGAALGLGGKKHSDRGLAAALAKETERLGANLDETTISKRLKEIPKALEAKSKG